jgi:hypothetical protein
LAGPGVLERVGQRLLHDPVGGQVDAGGQRPRFALDRQLDRQAGLAGGQHQRIEVGQAGLRGQRLATAAAVTQQPEQPAHLGQGLPARGLDLGQGGGGLRGVGGDAAPGRSGLHHHHAHGVGDDVVQLAGDPPPLLGHRPASPSFLLAGELGVERLQPGGVGEPALLQVAEEPGGHELHDGEHPALEALDAARGVHALDDHPVEDQAGAEQQPGHHGLPPRGVGGHRVQRHQHGDLGPGRLVAEDEVDEHRREADRQHQAGSAPSPHQRHRLAEGEQDGERVRVAEVPAEVGDQRALVEQLREADQGDQRGQQPVRHRRRQLPHPPEQGPTLVHGPKVASWGGGGILPADDRAVLPGDD